VYVSLILSFLFVLIIGALLLIVVLKVWQCMLYFALDVLYFFHIKSFTVMLMFPFRPTIVSYHGHFVLQSVKLVNYFY